MEKIYDLKKRSYIFARDVVLFINRIESCRVQFPIVSQLLRSATSIGANLVEGTSGISRRVMAAHYSIALRSANETKYWLCLIRDTMSVDRTAIARLLDEAVELSKILARAVITLKNEKVRGADF